MRRLVSIAMVGIIALSVCAGVLAKPVTEDVKKMRTNFDHGLRILGKWGYIGENETAGYFAAKIKRARRAFVIRGVWNTTDNAEKGRIFGVMKKCFFNGIIKTGNKVMPIVGLFKINRESHAITMKWMTPHEYGWAKGKIVRAKPLPD